MNFRFLKNQSILFYLTFILTALFGDLYSHGVTLGDKGYIQEIEGAFPIAFIYLGAKHMITGYDHLLFLFGVIFFLYKLKDIGIYVSLFALGHVITLLTGVFFEVKVNAYIIDAIIGLSVVYKSLDNLGAFKRLFNIQPSTKISTFLFGLIHGFGLATKVLEYEISPSGLWINLISFNLGVEIGQILALWIMLICIVFFRKSSKFKTYSYSINVFTMMLGFLLTGYQMAGYILA